jgi:hypothetical protein
MNESWIKETMELLEDWENQKQSLQNKLEQLQNELMDLEDSIVAGHALIQAYMSKHNITSLMPEGIKTGNFANMSYPDMLIEIAKMGQGYLKATDAVDILFQSGIAHNRRTIQANVYSALRRLKNTKRFVKKAPGEYRYVNHAKKNDSKPSGLRQAVKELKEKNPQMTKKEVLNHLMKSDFDFKGKKPANALNITWAYLGYSKEGKQQSLPGVSQ